MTKLPKILLTVSLSSFAVGFFGVCGGPNIPLFLSVGMPVGAIFLGLFIVTLAFDKEMTRFDLEERLRLESARIASKPVAATSRQKGPVEWPKPHRLADSTQAA
jgi:hypothetical protein